MKGIMFDLDGTLIDSMGVWQSMDQRYVESKGFVYNPETTETLKAASFEKAPEIFNSYYDMNATYEDMIGFMFGTLEVYYREKFELKDGVLDRLKELREAGVKMCITTATVSELTDLLVERLGLLDYMDFVLTPDTADTEKNNPDFFRLAIEKLGTKPENTYVFDDALYALEIAERMGMNPVGIYEPTSKPDYDRIRQLSRVFVHDFRELDLGFLI